MTVPQYTDWVVSTDGGVLGNAGTIAAIPRLDALVLENTAAPGYAGWGDYGDGLSERPR